MPARLPSETTLVTGFPAYTARRLALRLLREDARERVFLLVRHQDAGVASEFVAQLSGADQRRVTVLVGDATSMDLGLSGKEYRALMGELSCIHHLAARYHLGASKEEVSQANVGGTRGVVELALECQELRRFVFWSTIHVSGDREGVIMEDELEADQRFRNVYEQSKFAAEKIVRAMSRRVPSTILRPGIIVGDSATGEIDRFDGPYHLIAVLSNSPFDLQLPLPGKGDGPFHLVPIDFVVEAAHTIARQEETVSKTFHLVDPCPLSGRSVYQLVADRAHRAVPRGVIPPGIAKVLLKVPWVGQLKGSPRTIMEGFNQHVYYNCRNTLEALRGTEVWCPAFEKYVDNLVRFVRTQQASRRRQEEDVVDALDGGAL